MDHYNHIEKMEHAKLEEIDAITKEMEANRKLYNLNIETGEMTLKLRKSLDDQYHRSRIQRERLLGNLPAEAKQKTKFRNGVFY
jgi:hypothetical protein